MNEQSQGAIVANDLNSMAHRIEALGAHPRLTDALNLVQEAEAAVREGMSELHQLAMRHRFAKLDAA